MAHFYGSMQGGRGETTRTGTKYSGMNAHVRGWNLGIKIELSHENGRDIVSVYQTGGSNGHGPRILLAQIDEKEGLVASDLDLTNKTV